MFGNPGPRTVLGAFLYSLALGSCNGFGNLLNYIVSWQKEFTPYLKEEHIALILPLCFVVVYTMISLSIKIGGYFGYRKILIIVAICYPAGVFTSSYLHHWVFFALWYGAVACAFLGAGFMIPLYCSWEQYPEHRGQLTGLMVSAFSLSPLVLNFIAFQLANPNNLEATNTIYPDEPNTLYFDKGVTSRVPMMLQGMGLSLFVLCATGAALIKTPPSTSEPEVKTDLENENAITDSLNNSLNKEPEMTLKEAITSRQFIMLYVMFLSGLLLPQFMVIFYKNYGQIKINDDQFLTTVGSISAISSAASGLILGYLADKKSFKWVAISLYSVLTVAAILLPYLCQYKVSYFILTVTIFAGIGGSSAIFPPELGRIFGNNLGGSLYGILSTGNVLSFIIIVTMNFVVKDLIGYDWTILTFAACVGFSIFLVLIHSGEAISAGSNKDKIAETPTTVEF